MSTISSRNKMIVDEESFVKTMDELWESQDYNHDDKWVEHNAYLKLQEELDEAHKLIKTLSLKFDEIIEKSVSLKDAEFVAQEAREFLIKYPKKEG